MSVTPSDLDHVLELERELQSPAARTDLQRVRDLLAPDFIEIGASGQRWDRESILDLLAEEASDPGTGAISMSNVQTRVLSDDLVQVFWDSDRDGRRARRTSLWQRSGPRWRLIYHQGTVLA